MATEYIIQQGDHLAKIAEQFGFLTISPIWDHPTNCDLRQLRGTPNVLMPGDVVHVPDRTQKVMQMPTGYSHTFRTRCMDLMLRVVLLDHRFQPILNVACVLDVASSGDATTTDAQGIFSKKIKKSADAGKLVVGEQILPICIGHLDPASEVSGAQARLNALGYDAGDTNDPTDPGFRSAIEEFQCDAGLDVIGELNSQTVAKLLELHGC